MVNTEIEKIIKEVMEKDLGFRGVQILHIKALLVKALLALNKKHEEEVERLSKSICIVARDKDKIIIRLTKYIEDTNIKTQQKDKEIKKHEDWITSLCNDYHELKQQPTQQKEQFKEKVSELKEEIKAWMFGKTHDINTLNKLIDKTLLKKK